MAWGNVITCIALTVITILIVFNDMNVDKHKIWKESIVYERGRKK